jgi:hypothetical protein
LRPLPWQRTCGPAPRWAKAVRLVHEHAGDYPTEYAAITAVAGRLGMNPETRSPSPTP